MAPREAKQVIVIRRDLGMRRGKEIAQGAHASVAWISERLNRNRHCDDSETGDAWLEGEFTAAEMAWLEGTFTKVVCQVPSAEALEEIYLRALELGIKAHLIQDAGRTEFHGVPTFTAAAIGPDWTDKVDVVTGQLQLY